MTKRKRPRLQMVGFHPKPDMFHIGRKAPKGYVESGPAIHLGKGIWLLPLKLATASTSKESK